MSTPRTIAIGEPPKHGIIGEKVPVVVLEIAVIERFLRCSLCVGGPRNYRRITAQAPLHARSRCCNDKRWVAGFRVATCEHSVQRIASTPQ